MCALLAQQIRPRTQVIQLCKMEVRQQLAAQRITTTQLLLLRLVARPEQLSWCVGTPCVPASVTILGNGSQNSRRILVEHAECRARLSLWRGSRCVQSRRQDVCAYRRRQGASKPES